MFTEFEPSRKIHVVLALLFILISIALNLCVPIFLKEAINALSGQVLSQKLAHAYNEIIETETGVSNDQF